MCWAHPRKTGRWTAVAIALAARTAFAQSKPEAVPSPAWNLKTDDTQITLTIVGGHPAIVRLSDADPKAGWNWVNSEIVLPLLERVYVKGTRYTPSWNWQGATGDGLNANTVKLTFRSTPSADHVPGEGLVLEETWRAAPGPGPVEETVSVTNETGGELTLDDADVVAADLTVQADDTVTLWRFGRESVNTVADPNFNTGVFRTRMTAHLQGPAAIGSTISNDCTAGPYFLPFVMLDVGEVHGLYLGYECDFGRFSQTTDQDAKAIRSTFLLWGSGRMSLAAGAVLPLPGMFYGAYRGDTDTGSNRMKEWFWNQKITPTIKSTPNEPLVEINIATDLRPITPLDNTQAVCAAWFAGNPVARWGVELAKLDEGWTRDFRTDSWNWDPNPQTWPEGMVAGRIAHDNGVQLSLYLLNRYEHANLATPEGVHSEQQALLSRYDNWRYDYWRTDGEFEPTADYLSHLGFLQVLDYMIAKRPPGYAGRPGFRWENCSAGGSKKSFDLLERQSMMTLEDSGGWFPSLSGLNYLKAYYANSYMICPVQMKDDNIDVPNYPPNPGLRDTVPWEKYTFRTGFLGAWMYGYSGQVYPQHIALYRRYQRPILRGADVYHLAGFPFPDGRHWDGFEFFNPSLNKGSVILLKPLDSRVSDAPVIYLKGLSPTATYTLTFQDRTQMNAAYVSVAGSSLTAGGQGIAPLSGNPNDYDSEIIWINQ